MLRKVIQFTVKELFLCLFSAALLILSFPNFNIWLFAWFGFVPVFFALRNKPLKEAFFLFFITGIIFWWGTIYWLVHVTLIGTILLILYLALYFALFGLIIRPFTRRSSVYGLIFIPAVWVLLEYIRGRLMMSGFPWALLGYSQYLNLPVIQIADITGTWGVSFLIIFVNVAIVEIIWSIKNNFISRLRTVSIFLILVLILTLGYGYYRLHGRPAGQVGGRRIKISVVQGNIPQELKWASHAQTYILDKYAQLTEQAARGNPDLVIWPEAALPAVLEEEPALFERVTDIAVETKTPLLLGAVTAQGGFYSNSAVLVSSQGKTLQRYHKLHLVPFGEYIPLRKVLSFLETIAPIGEITPGKDYTIFKLPAPPVNPSQKSQGFSPRDEYILHSAREGASAFKPRGSTFAVLICFEDLFPELARGFVNKGAGFLVNITNDAWYKRTSAAHQHLQASVFRAVENRVNVARAANTGVSGFIAPNGKIISLVQDAKGQDIFIDGYQIQEITVIEKKPTFYTRYGDVFILILFIFVVYTIFRLARYSPI